MLTSICGINWGDEGKGRMVDLLSEDYNIVCRYQGGNNAGHTVINERGKFILNLMPSGILRPGVVCVMGNGMAIDLAPKGIRVNCVCPGVVETALFDAGTVTSEQLEARRRAYPLRRFGRPEEIAWAIVYLLSDASAWMTGTDLKIDGGLTLI